jgi:hypothetical protein
MAAKVPAAAGSTPLAGDWKNQTPVYTGTNHGGVIAGQLGPPDLVLPFQPTNSANDIDTGDTFALWGSATTGPMVRTYAWIPGSAVQVRIDYDGAGTFTFTTSAANAAGWLAVWFG